jgi:S-adenosylmethionine:diacylglycerol 3-amino-3-carboxypropyl transferase
VTADTPWATGRFDTKAGPHKILFGRMYEDVAIEASAFKPGGRVFSIASAGCTAMALAATHEVTAVDINPVQLDYARARAAGAPMQVGSAERVMHVGRALLAPFGWRRRTLQDFLALDALNAQQAFWAAHLDTLAFRMATDALFSVRGLSAVYASPFLALLPPHFGRVMRARLARTFARHANRTNPYARALLDGGPAPEAMLPRTAPIAFACADAAEYLERGPPASFDGFTLSNILDGAPTTYRARLFAAVRRAAAPAAVVVLRSFAEPAHATPTNRAVGDRSVLWGIVDVRRVVDLAE